MSLWLVRHAQPLIAPGICYGQLDMAADVQATQVCAQTLAEIIPSGTRISCSPLQRCRQLAQALLALRPDLACQTDARLQEMHFGHWEGRAWANIARAELDAWTELFADYAAGQTGESVGRFMARVASAFDELPQDRHTLWITHAGVIRAAQLMAGGVRQLKRADQWPTAAPAYGQWCELELRRLP
ncbi:MAG: histidine phosphatase family protein [Pseudomonadota bacterium]